MRALTLALALCLLLGPPVAAAREAPAPGGVEVTARGRAVHIRANGYADLEQGQIMRRDAVLRIASLTKQFTAVAVLGLVEDGRLSLDDRLVQRLPDCPVAWQQITIRQLLSHTSGLSGSLAPLIAHIHDDLTPRQLIDLYANLPVATPGERWAYANLNYWILGLVIEASAGEPYAAYVWRRALEPAHLIDTRIGDARDIIPRRIHGYERTDAGTYENARHFSSTLGYAAGGYVSSARDMARWYDALTQGRIISRETLELALAPVRLNDGAPAPYGLGWYLSTIDGHLLAHHGGSTFGFRSYVYWRPDTGAFAGIFLNSSGDDEPQAEALALFQSEEHGN